MEFLWDLDSEVNIFLLMTYQMYIRSPTLRVPYGENHFRVRERADQLRREHASGEVGDAVVAG